MLVLTGLKRSLTNDSLTIAHKEKHHEVRIGCGKKPHLTEGL